MDDGGSPTLEVGFAIDTGGSFAELTQLQKLMNSTEARVVADAAKIERATAGMVNVGAGVAAIGTFGNAYTREGANIARAKAQAEKAGESLIRQLNRETTALLQTKDQMRDAKVEAAALAAAQLGLADVSDRLLAAARARTAAEEAAAEAKQVAADRAAAAAAREEQAVRSASLAYAMFEAAARKGMAAWREAQAVEAAAAAEMQSMANAAARLRAQLDPAVAAQQRFDREMGSARTLIAANAITLDEYCAKLRMERQILEEVNTGHAGGVKSAGAMKYAMQGLSFQVQDTFTQLSMGANALQVIAIQGGQAAGQFANVEGRAGAVARFMIGPWGLAFTAAALVLGPLLGKLMNMNNAMDEALDKLKKDAEQTEITRLAKEAFGKTTEGVTAALREQDEVLKKVEASLYSAAEQANIQAHNERDAAVAIRDKTLAMLEQQRVQAQREVASLRDQPMSADQFGAGALGLGKAQERLSGIESQITKIQNNALAAERQYQGTRVAIAAETAKALSTEEGKINRIYDQQAAAAQRRAYALARGGGTVVTTALTDELLGIEKNRQAALRAEEQRQAALKETTKEIGRNISMLEARRIAESVGGRITSGTRTRAEQEALMRRREAYLAGRGPFQGPVAPPGTSAHEMGRALDIAKTQGMTLKKLVDAYRAAGVKITKALDEGDHFHIAWGKVGDAAKAETAAMRAQKSAADEVKRALEAATRAAQEYAAAQIDDANKIGMSAKELRLYADAAAIAKAPTDALKQAIRDAAAVREAAYAKNSAEDFDKNVLQPLRDELALYGLVGPARAAAALELERSSFISKNSASSAPDDVSDAIAKWMEYKRIKSEIIGKDDAADREAASIRNMAEQFDFLLDAADRAGDAFARSFGKAGDAVADLLHAYTDYASKRARIDEKLRHGDITQAQAAQQNGAAQVGAYGDALSAAKGFFDEKSRIYKALQTAEMAFRAVQLAMSIASMFQDTAETVTHVANAGARATANAAEGVSAQAKLPFPANIAAMAATAAAVVAFGIAMLGGRGGGGHVVAPTSSEDLQKAAGTGTVLGSPSDKSASIARSLDLVAKNTDGVLQYNSQMLNSLRSIDASIGAMAATVARQINMSGSLYDTKKLNLGASGSAGFLGLFSSSTTRSLYDAGITLAATTVGDIVANGIAGQTYQIVEQVKKSSGFLGIGGGTKTTYQTTSGGLPSDVAASIQNVIGALENGIVTAAGAIGIDGAKAMLDNFTVSIGQLSFNGLDAQGIEDQLNAVFSSVGDQMVAAILPGIVKFQRVGEGLFETLERVASTVGAVDAAMQKLGRTTTTMGIDVDMGVANMFDSVSDFTSAANAYFETYYSTAEQTAAKTAQLGKVFESLNLAMPDTLAQFRALVEAQDLTTAAGQATFATLLQLAPAFADLKSAMDGAKSAADIASERTDLQRQLLQLKGDTAALRALDLAKIDPSNRALQQQIWDLSDAQDAAKAAQQLADAWKSVGDSILDEVNRIRGLNGTGTSSYATLLGQFNAANAAARGGDQDAAKSLPGLSQALLTAAAAVATSQQELRRVQAQTAASLEATYAAISGFMTGSTTPNDASSTNALIAAISTSQAASAPTAANDDLIDEIQGLRDEIVRMREENNSGHAATAGNTGSMKRTLDNVTAASGGDSISTVIAA